MTTFFLNVLLAAILDEGRAAVELEQARLLITRNGFQHYNPIVMLFQMIYLVV